MILFKNGVLGEMKGFIQVYFEKKSVFEIMKLYFDKLL